MSPRFPGGSSPGIPGGNRPGNIYQGSLARSGVVVIVAHLPARLQHMLPLAVVKILLELL
ncbi:hypothetical protein Pyn_05617 [Prunus yedoensis var. nudiflora]|uniref:Uncharacterized protein n=1 Tax=Prunus yedoensis var. nudiflora TaxID=2094558 RepID=A0A314URG5_PRUYE|nr:hypothetical protein Pyn_05617 [Prunus yedoensis var. nudiflora]